jgi:hypothetical protein
MGALARATSLLGGRGLLEPGASTCTRTHPLGTACGEAASRRIRVSPANLGKPVYSQAHQGARNTASSSRQREGGKKTHALAPFCSSRAMETLLVLPS